MELGGVWRTNESLAKPVRTFANKFLPVWTLAQFSKYMLIFPV